MFVPQTVVHYQILFGDLRTDTWSFSGQILTPWFGSAEIAEWDWACAVAPWHRSPAHLDCVYIAEALF